MIYFIQAQRLNRANSVRTMFVCDHVCLVQRLNDTDCELPDFIGEDGRIEDSRWLYTYGRAPEGTRTVAPAQCNSCYTVLWEALEPPCTFCGQTGHDREHCLDRRRHEHNVQPPEGTGDNCACGEGYWVGAEHPWIGVDGTTHRVSVCSVEPENIVAHCGRCGRRFGVHVGTMCPDGTRNGWTSADAPDTSGVIEASITVARGEYTIAMMPETGSFARAIAT